MKRIVVFILFGVMLLSLGACADGEHSKESLPSGMENADGAVEDGYDWIDDLTK